VRRLLDYYGAVPIWINRCRSKSTEIWADDKYGRSINGYTALTLACNNGHSAALQLLLARDACTEQQEAVEASQHYSSQSRREIANEHDHQSRCEDNELYTYIND
jgi:ankyrin repeat protein